MPKNLPHAKEFAQDFVRLRHMPDVTIILNSLDAFCLLCQIQLALRHPKNTGPSSDIVRRFALRLQKIVTPTPALRAVAQAGWDPDLDVKTEEIP